MIIVKKAAEEFKPLRPVRRPQVPATPTPFEEEEPGVPEEYTGPLLAPRPQALVEPEPEIPEPAEPEPEIPEPAEEEPEIPEPADEEGVMRDEPELPLVENKPKVIIKSPTKPVPLGTPSQEWGWERNDPGIGQSMDEDEEEEEESLTDEPIATPTEITSEMDAMGLHLSQLLGPMNEKKEEAMRAGGDEAVYALWDDPEFEQAQEQARSLIDKIVNSKMEFQQRPGEKPREPQTAEDYVRDRHRSLISLKQSKGVPSEQLQEIPEADDALYDMIMAFAESAHENPGAKNSLTAYIIANWRRFMEPPNPFYRFMKYIKNPRTTVTEEVRNEGAERGWSWPRQVLEQYKHDAWGDPSKPYSPEAIEERVRKGAEWWEKMYERIQKSGKVLPDYMEEADPIKINLKKMPDGRFKGDTAAIRIMSEVFDFTAQYHPDLAEALGLITRTPATLKKYRQDGEFGIDPNKALNPDVLDWWNEMYGKISSRVEGLPPMSLSQASSRQDIAAMKKAFDDFVGRYPKEAINLGMADADVIISHPYKRKGSKYYMSDEITDPIRRQVSEKKVQEAIESAGKTKSMNAEDQEGRKIQVSEEDVKKETGELAGLAEDKKIVNPMTMFRRKYKPQAYGPDTRRSPKKKSREDKNKTTEAGILSAVWGRQVAREFMMGKDLERRVKATLDHHVSDDELHNIMLEHDISRAYGPLIDLYFKRKPEAMKILGEAGRKWESIRPSFSIGATPEAIERETKRRQAALSIIADHVTTPKSVEREIAKTIAGMPLERGGSGGLYKPEHMVNKELGEKNALENVATMNALFERLRSKFQGRGESRGHALKKFNDAVREVVGRMIGALANDDTFARIERDLRSKGFNLRGGSWRSALMSHLRIVRFALRGLMMEKVS